MLSVASVSGMKSAPQLRSSAAIPPLAARTRSRQRHPPSKPRASLHRVEIDASFTAPSKTMLESPGATARANTRRSSFPRAIVSSRPSSALIALLPALDICSAMPRAAATVTAITTSATMTSSNVMPVRLPNDRIVSLRSIHRC